MATASSALAISREPNRSLDRALAAARAAELSRGKDVVILDLRELTSVFDYFIIVTGASRRQLHAIAEEVDRVMESDFGDKRLGLEGYQESRWILLDYGDIVVHMFDEETRSYYGLEHLWSAATRVPYQSVVGETK